MVVILVKAMGIAIEDGNEAVVTKLSASGAGKSGFGYVDFDSVPVWAKPYYLKAIEKNIIKGYQDNTIRPGNLVSRAEAFTMIFNIL